MHETMELNLAYEVHVWFAINARRPVLGRFYFVDRFPGVQLRGCCSIGDGMLVKDK